MKKFLSLILTLTIFLTLTACGSKGGGTEVTIFAAASMTESLTAIAEAYRAKAPDVTLIFNFDSSGTLKTQIEEGAECDIFISAAQKQMDELSKIDPESRIDLLGNQVVLITAEGSGTTPLILPIWPWEIIPCWHWAIPTCPWANMPWRSWII